MSSPYQAILLDHFRTPRHASVWAPDEPHFLLNNPLCGDAISIQAELDQGCLATISYSVKGCAVLTASASIQSVLLVDRELKEASEIIEAYLAYFDHRDAWEHGLDDSMTALCELRKTPMRIKCATLPWLALQAFLAGERS